jgi:hypothetical protein
MLRLVLARLGGALEMLISIIATFISSIALAGVAVSLILQARQLRTSQIQAVRSLQIELIKIGLNDPLLGTSISPGVEPSEAPKAALLNLTLMVWRVGYSLNTFSKGVISYNARGIFKSEYSRTWWEIAHESYEINASTKRDKEFVALINAEFQNAVHANRSNVSTTELNQGQSGNTTIEGS